MSHHDHLLQGKDLLQTSDVQVDPYELFDRTRRRAAAVPEVEMCLPLARELLEHPDTDGVLFALDQLIRHTLWGDERARQAVLGLSLFLIRAEAGRVEDFSLQTLGALHTASIDAQKPHLTALFLDLPPHKEILDKRTLLQGPKYDRDISLGERRQLAAGGNRRMLAQIMADHHPMVVHRLCNNSRLREQDILQICARRPTLAESLHTVAVHKRWVARYQVRKAILLNPYTRTGVALKYLPLLTGQDLKEVSMAKDVASEISQAAHHFLDIRSLRLR